MKKIKKIIIFSDSHDWHSNELKKELKKLNCKVFCLSLDDCFINTNNKNNIFIPGFSKNLPDGCFIRTIGKGTFQQITRRLTILHVLKKLKVVLFNDVNCIDRILLDRIHRIKFKHLSLEEKQVASDSNLQQIKGELFESKII